MVGLTFVNPRVVLAQTWGLLWVQHMEDELPLQALATSGADWMSQSFDCSGDQYNAAAQALESTTTDAMATVTATAHHGAIALATALKIRRSPPADLPSADFVPSTPQALPERLAQCSAQLRA